MPCSCIGSHLCDISTQLLQAIACDLDQGTERNDTYWLVLSFRDGFNEPESEDKLKKKAD